MATMRDEVDAVMDCCGVPAARRCWCGNTLTFLTPAGERYSRAIDVRRSPANPMSVAVLDDIACAAGWAALLP